MKIKDIQHRIIHKDQYAYSAHPLIVNVANGDWLVVFNKTVRSVMNLHPPEDPRFYNFTIRSHDQGQTWGAPRVAPGYDWHGVETAGLTPLRNGNILHNQWQFKWYPVETARLLASEKKLLFVEDWLAEIQRMGEAETGTFIPDNIADLAPWARGNGGTYVHISTDMGHTWMKTVEIDTHPYTGGYGKCQGVEMPDGEILLPLSDVPQFEKIFLIRSSDGGYSWSKPTPVASLDGHYFEEPTTLLLPDGKILMMLRDNNTHYLYQTVSDDGGYTWSTPKQTEIWGYPAHMVAMQDGKIMCIYGHRAKPFGIRMVFSYDLGATWDTQNILAIRDDFPNRNLGYPSSLLAPDGSVYCVYYGEDTDGVTCIHSSQFFLEE